MNLRELLQNHAPQGPTETRMHAKIAAFLGSLREGETGTGRELLGAENLRGHLTASAWIVDENREKTVLLYHRKLGKWLQSGGHIEEGETDLQLAAQREANEETGLEIEPIGAQIFDVDVHEIPEYWNTPAHLHFDIRFLFRGDSTQIPVQNAESKGVRWVNLDQVRELVNGEESVMRMVEKTR